MCVADTLGGRMTNKKRKSKPMGLIPETELIARKRYLLDRVWDLLIAVISGIIVGLVVGLVL